MLARTSSSRSLPGYPLTLGYTVFYLSLVILIPLSTVFVSAAKVPFAKLVTLLNNQVVISAFKVSFVASFCASFVNVCFGLLLAWVLARYTFPGRRLLDAAIDLPFALPTAVAGLSLSAVYAPQGWLGRYLEPRGIQVVHTNIGVFVALVFIGLPFVVRTVEPVLDDLDLQVEEAAASLGATRFQTIRRVLLPALVPATLTGFALAFARSLGEYGSVQFISSNLPGKTEVIPSVIMDRLGEYNYAGASAIAAVMLIISFLLLLTINVLQNWASRYQ